MLIRNRKIFSRLLTSMPALVFFFHSHAQPVVNREDLLADLKIFADSLPILHKNIYARLSKTEFESSVDAIRKNENSDYGAFVLEVMRLVARTGDEHMDIRPVSSSVFPFRFELIGGSVVIVASYIEYRNWLSYRVVAINDISMEDIRKSFDQLILQDNSSFADFTFLRQFNKPLLLQALGIMKGMKEASFKLLSPSGESITTVIQTVAPSQVINSNIVFADQLKDLVAHQEPTAYGFQYLPEKKTIYFNYKSCRERKDLPFADFNAKLFESIEKEKPDKIILDLRQNSGGNSGILAPFIKSIRKSYLNQPDKFFVLIGKAVFSSAVMNAVEIKRTTNATFVGEMTGGNINHYGEVKTLLLSRTGIRVSYSTKYWETWKGHDGGLKPDVERSLGYEEFLKGVDSVLEFALGNQ